jgi:hypothetical protein
MTDGVADHGHAYVVMVLAPPIGFETWYTTALAKRRSQFKRRLRVHCRRTTLAEALEEARLANTTPNTAAYVRYSGDWTEVGRESYNRLLKELGLDP